MTRKKALLQAVQESREGDQSIEKLTHTEFYLIDREIPGLGDVMADIICAQVNEVTSARTALVQEAIRQIVIQHSAWCVWVGRRSREIEAGGTLKK